MAVYNNNLKEYSITELSTTLKKHVEDGFSFVKVRGELGRISRPSSGHIYLDLKDDHAVLSCVVWRTNSVMESSILEEGCEE